jgi:hypothetical protein
MPAVTDPEGTKWSVHRRWWPLPRAFTLLDLVNHLDIWGILLVLPMLLSWPFWLLAKFVGVRWRLVVKRESTEVDQELVRGWGRSTARVEELVADIRDGGVSLPKDAIADH